MSFRCANCNKVIEVFSEFWLREPDTFDANGVAISRGKALPFCRLECIFGYCARRMNKGKKKQKVEAEKGCGDASRS